MIHPVLVLSCIGWKDLIELPPVCPERDGFMALTLRRYEMQKQRIFDAGYTLPLAAARGPLCLASFLRGMTEFLMDLIQDPENAHRLLARTTETVIAWLKAQAEVIGDSVEGILVLDDIVGTIGPGIVSGICASLSLPNLRRFPC